MNARPEYFYPSQHLLQGSTPCWREHGRLMVNAQGDVRHADNEIQAALRGSFTQLYTARRADGSSM